MCAYALVDVYHASSSLNDAPEHSNRIPMLPDRDVFGKPCFIFQMHPSNVRSPFHLNFFLSTLKTFLKEEGV